MRLRAIEDALTTQLRWPLLLVSSVACRSSHHLSGQERAYYLTLQHSQRRLDWLNGRSALRRLLRALGEMSETTEFSFPHPRLSLSHAGARAVAVGSPERPIGLGIDYEPVRSVQAGVARWFLNYKEEAWLARQPESRHSREILRLWTIKEAAYKSQPLNAELSMSDFSLGNPAVMSGEVQLNGSVESIRYVTRRFACGFLTVALCAG